MEQAVTPSATIIRLDRTPGRKAIKAGRTRSFVNDWGCDGYMRAGSDQFILNGFPDQFGRVFCLNFIHDIPPVSVYGPDAYKQLIPDLFVA